ncbi:hypothetical protein Q4561_00830 [Alteromonas sp. 1_MG-2023]|uniref:hypothetical protein n=1 Tax=Alteromonas sp. 1_MG-2023 TaxID=3062669 RepID=UPI0026E2E194|nr:hypothetical protein [Alteromonas sp. 1_MG-2023]MDO6565590.1 hypothetical protein [Alteromonas sp. 1_MG-2023]
MENESVNNLYHTKKSKAFALALLIFACAICFNQSVVKPISSKHHYDASIVEQIVESGVEDNTQDDPYPVVCLSQVDAYVVVSDAIIFTTYACPHTFNSYVTPFTRAPPVA